MKNNPTIKKQQKEISSLLTEISQAYTSLSFLIETSFFKEKKSKDEEFLNLLFETFKLMEKDLLSLSKNPKSSERICRIIDNTPDSISKINLLFSEFLYPYSCSSSIWKTISSYLKLEMKLQSPERLRLLKIKALHLQRLMILSDKILSDYSNLLCSLSHNSSLKRIVPVSLKNTISGAKSFLELQLENMDEKVLFNHLSNIEESFDDEPQRKILRRYQDNFIEVSLDSPRPIDKFFGYPTARTFFKKYLESFSLGKENSPLLITSLPGLGKTHFTISFTLAMKNLTLILCEPSDLEKPLEKIIKELSVKSNRKYVMFFDDVDTRKINWYYFRTNVGGTFNLPPNILIVIASNYDFPANIASRGRCFSFPLFDEINCMEMIHDYLLSIGMRSPSKELVSVIAADYVEEYGQRIFEELSPRTLVRYLDRFSQDTKKRIKLLNISRDKVVPIPEAAVFYETNQKVIQRLKESI
ncbi:MAG TPA: hypothetical protein PLN24_08745 [Victivallales bacterium]|nr:hypothetical protein [Victivallales bacterium]HPO91100.1 hypothetical protein [Victivallales bacterium]HRU00808.1 hypothetical protein [Victivallales bacterium]